MMSIDALKFNDNAAVAPHDFLDYALTHGFGDLHFKINYVNSIFCFKYC